ncbi:MAG TPA: DegT/DnrJ/EryC1/StrS family aminotransferase, partial [Thermodesulfobacteriota bacterium]|nr:DegT/DnrJ/EryC1/StrS family aminotransferase [Thermodesulfobacteriota bacterium]
PAFGVTARRMLKLIVYHLLTEPRLHRYARSIYELLGRRQPLPRPTTREELQGLRPPAYEERLSNAQAAVGIRQLSRLSANLKHRREIARLYEQQFREARFHPPRPPLKADPAYVRYPVWVEDRPNAVNIPARNMVLGTWFTSVLEECVSPRHGNYEDGSCPAAENAARHLINLPTHPRVTPRDAEAISREVLAMFAASSPKEIAVPLHAPT